MTPRRAGRLLFDTSVLAPALMTTLPEHARAKRWLARVLEGDFKLVVAAHSLAETYSMMTRLPAPHRVRPDAAAFAIRTNVVRARAIVTALDADDYVDVITDLSARGLSGGVVYDALIARAAKKANARIVTFNVADFRRVCADPDRDVVPADQ